jgi:hypothetical protein
MAKRRDPYADQAAAQALVRFGPETSALTALLRAAEQSYEDRVRTAVASRRRSVGAVDAALPQVSAAYAGAQAAVQPAFTAQGGVEAGALQARLGEADALARAQLAARSVSAVEGEGAARDQALRDFRTDRGKIGDRATDLAREIGAFTTATAGDLRGADAAAQAKIDELNARLRQDERESIRSAGFDPDTGAPLPGGKADPNRDKGGGKKWASQTVQAEAQDDIDSLRGFAEKLKAADVNRRDAAQALQTGQESKPVFRTVQVKDRYGNVTGTKQERVLDPKTGAQVMTPAVPQAKSRLLLAAALDVAYDGHLSRRTQKLLHDRGIKIAPLGLMTFGQWLKTPEGQEWKRKQRGRTRTPAQDRSPHATGGPTDRVPGYHGRI